MLLIIGLLQSKLGVDTHLSVASELEVLTDHLDFVSTQSALLSIQIIKSILHPPLTNQIKRKAFLVLSHLTNPAKYQIPPALSVTKQLTTAIT